jgi:hypothetical protein
MEGGLCGPAGGTRGADLNKGGLWNRGNGVLAGNWLMQLLQIVVTDLARH